MSRTTLDIDASVLRELKRRQKKEGKTLGRLVSELLANALERQDAQTYESLGWHTQAMNATVDLEDKEALNAALDGR